MKYFILLISAFLFYSANAQFTGTDSLRNYNNRFITNNASAAFTNLRLHNLLAGIIDFIDTANAGGSIALGVDTIYVTQDSIVHYKKNGVFRQFVVRGNPGAGSLGQIPFSDGVGRFSNDSNFIYDKSQGANNGRLVVGPTVINDGGLSKINATSDNMNAMALTAFGTGTTTIVLRRALGSIGIPLAITSGTDLWNFSGRGYTGLGFTTSSRASIYAQTTQNWSDTTQGTAIYLGTTSNDSSSMQTRMILNDSVQVQPVIATDADSIAAFKRNANGLATMYMIPKLVSSGSIDTAENLGSGVGIFKSKLTNKLQFKSITTPASVTATSNTNDVAIKLVNDESTPNKWKFYGTNIKDSSKGFKEIEENFVGILYNKNSWTSGTFTTDFTPTMMTSNIVSNKIQLTPTVTGIYSCRLAINNLLDTIPFTNLQKWKATIRVIVDEKNGTSYGFGVGMKSYNDYGKIDALGRFAAYTGAGNILISGSYDSVNLALSSRQLSFSQGDKVLLTTERDGNLMRTSVRNITTNSSIIDTLYYYSSSGGAVLPNTGKFAIWGFGGQFTIDSICISSNEVKNARLMVGGNSKMTASFASDYTLATPYMLNNNFKTTVLHAGGSDRTLDFARTLPEILNQRPQQIILVDLMSNGLRSGELAATEYARYDSITNVLTNAGIDIFHAPLYETSIDLSGAYNHIVSTYPANRVLNTYPVMQRGGNLYSDGIHITDAGFLDLYNTIIQSYALYGGNNRYGSSGGQSISGTSNFMARFTSPITIGDSHVSDNGTTINSSLPLRIQNVDYLDQGAATNAKHWNVTSSGGNLTISASNDAGTSSSNVMNFSRSGATPGTTTMYTPITVSQSSGVAIDIAPVVGSIGIQGTGTVAGYYIPNYYSINASGGLFANYINTNTGSSANTVMAIRSTGSGGGNPYTAYGDNSNNNEWATGFHISSGDFRINNGTFPGVSGGNNRFRISSAGAITFNNTYTFPTADGSNGQVLKTDGSGSISWGDGKNFFNANLSATGNRSHNFKGYDLEIDSIGDLNLITKGAFFGTPIYNQFNFLHNSGSSPLRIASSMPKLDNSADSIIVAIIGSLQQLTLAASNISNNHNSSIMIGSSGTGKANISVRSDSLDIASQIKTSADSMYVPGAWDNTNHTNPVYKVSIADALGYKKYNANLTQSSTSDPTASILGSNQIGSIVWTRSGLGAYVGTLSGAFTSGKTFILVGQNADGITANCFRIDNNTITLKTYLTSTGGSTDGFSDLSIEVRIYP